MTKEKQKGIAPNGAYLAGSVEAGDVLELKKGNTLNTVEEIAPAPSVSETEPSRPSCGVTTRDREVVTPKPQLVKDAVAKPVSKTTIEKQLGSNLYLGN